MSNNFKEIKQKNYSAESVVIDNTQFIDCNFNESTLIYEGLGPVGFQGCNFNSTKWSLDQYAMNTVGFLHAIYHGMGSVGQQMVEGTFKKIKESEPMSSNISKSTSAYDLPEELGKYSRKAMSYDGYYIIEYSKKPVFKEVMESVSEDFIKENLLFDVKEQSLSSAVEVIKEKFIACLQQNG
jgi:hypothetical protein